MADIVLINPRFEASYWGHEHALHLFWKKAAMPVAALPAGGPAAEECDRPPGRISSGESLANDRCVRVSL